MFFMFHAYFNLLFIEVYLKKNKFTQIKNIDFQILNI